jgi:hypothetical protein
MGKKRQSSKSNGSLEAIEGVFRELQHDDEIGGQSDRGAALAFHAILEFIVRATLYWRLGKSKSAERLVGTDDTAGVLGYSDQCHLAHGLGIINDDELSDLKTLAKIRNRFAHTLNRQAFRKGKIKDLCISLRMPGGYSEEDREGPRPLRYRYLFVGTFLVKVFYEHIEELAKAEAASQHPGDPKEPHQE